MDSITDETTLKAAISSGEERLVLFYAEWCPFCVAFLPVYEKLAAGPKRLKFLVDEFGALEEEYSIEVVPTVLFFKDGRLAARLDGILGKGLDARMLAGFLRR